MTISEGQVFGRWTVIDAVKRNGYITCKCSCGTVKNVYAQNLNRGKTKSCGCYRKEYLSDLKTNGGRDNPRLYAIWCKMKDRCYNRNVNDYPNYGARGITVCDEWRHDFPAFMKWAFNNGYKDNLTIDRVDNDKSYSPDNCRWETRAVQNNNKRNNHFIEINGVSKTIAGWAEYSGLKRQTIQSRLKYGWPDEQLILPTKGLGANGSTAR